MKKFIVILSAAIAFVVFGYNYSTAIEYENPVESTTQSGTEYLGLVNLCDGNGIKCLVAKAFRQVNGRIYVEVGKDNYWAQQSNDYRWSYMIRYDNNWLYFSL